MDKYVNYYNNEEHILEEMQLMCMCLNNNIFIYPNKNHKHNILKGVLWSLLDKKLYKENWIVSSGKGDLTPDFYSDKLHLMMDSMRCSDSEIGNRNQSIVNEAKSFNKVKEILNKFPNVEQFVHIDNSQEYSSYAQYISSFKRVIEEHDKQFPIYRKNHPNYKLIYLVFDESEFIYYENYNPEEIIHTNLKIHEHYLDEQFINVIKKSKADYIIWYAPYKKNSNWGHYLPEISIFDIKNMDLSKVKKYKTEKMK